MQSLQEFIGDRVDKGMESETECVTLNVHVKTSVPSSRLGTLIKANMESEMVTTGTLYHRQIMENTYGAIITKRVNFVVNFVNYFLRCLMSWRSYQTESSALD